MKINDFKSGMKIALLLHILMRLRILTICYLSSICKLIKKSFSPDLFDFVCIEYRDNDCKTIEDEISEKLDRAPDGVIIDRGVEREFTEAISKKFAGAKIMYLPSLEDISNGSISNGPGIIKLSEPFSLKEIREILLNLYEEKFGELK